MIVKTKTTVILHFIWAENTPVSILYVLKLDMFQFKSFHSIENWRLYGKYDWNKLIFHTCLCMFLTENMTCFSIFFSSRDFSFKCSSLAIWEYLNNPDKSFDKSFLTILDYNISLQAMRRLNLSAISHQ